MTTQEIELRFEKWWPVAPLGVEALTETIELTADAIQMIRSLRKEIETAPHQMGCASLQGGPGTEGWASLDKCDCWKCKALSL